MHPDDLACAVQRWEEAVRQGTRYRSEHRIRRHDGQWRWMSVHAVPIRDDSGRIVEWTGMNLDITERKQAEDAARDSQAKLKAALESMTDAVFISDATGRFVDFNHAFVTFHRFRSRDELLLNLSDYLAVLEESFPDGTVAPLEMWAVPRALRGETATEAEYHLRRKDTGESWIGSYNFAPIRDAHGAIVGSVVVGRDITKRKRMEEMLKDREARLSAILDCATDAIITMDRHGIIRTVNPATERMFGFTSDEMIGKNVTMLMPPPYRDEHDGYIARYLKTGEAHIIGRSWEVVGRRKDGTDFPIDLAVSEIDHLQKFTGIVRDISRRKELEREVVEIASREQRRIGQDLHDTVSQELTALGIQATHLAETMRMDPSAAAVLVEKMTGGLRCAQQELRAVMRGLLPVSVDIEGLMAALAELADRTQKDNKVTWTFDCPELVSVADNLVATHLYLIVQEAVHNALKHAEPKNILIRLESGDLLSLSVQDDGKGIPEANRRASDTGGLGLRIMRNRAAIIGATLAIERVDPTGTRIRCTLPRMNHA